MDHLTHLVESREDVPIAFQKRITGRYYTHKAVAMHMIKALLKNNKRSLANKETLTVCDPFAGDGRLVKWLLAEWMRVGMPRVKWHLILIDLNTEGLQQAEKNINAFCRDNDIDTIVNIVETDSFVYASAHLHNKCDIVITNPPWELLKPDSRELTQFSKDIRESYVDSMKAYDKVLADLFPLSQPNRKFAGWGTNLSRVGLELSRSLVRNNGHIAIVMPASFLADSQSAALRKTILSESRLTDVAYFPSEARLFDGADVSTAAMLIKKCRAKSLSVLLTRYGKSLSQESKELIRLSGDMLEQLDFMLPVAFGANVIDIQFKLVSSMSKWDELETRDRTGLWAGREIDETRSSLWLTKSGESPLFVKGRMIDRYQIREYPQLHAAKPEYRIPQSINFERIAWRDVSRPSQKRRLIATIIPEGWIAGNSLGVAHFRDGDPIALRALLGIMNSVCFEFQLRSHLATGHVSLSALRKVRCPSQKILSRLSRLASHVDNALSGDERSESYIEAFVSRNVYGLSISDLRTILDQFSHVTKSERDLILSAYKQLENTSGDTSSSAKNSIPNHTSARLSDTDMKMVLAVPQGGNWKNIPESIPSKRLDKIRASYKAGEGSRSTYYGRLQPEKPSYTINTYFNRPGNGCHIHYSQDRVLSQREAARLQSFPDWFKFIGPQGSINNQIGNAVPPLLGYQIAQALGPPGIYIDLFSGAGGLGLGFKMAGWQPIVANDIEERFLETYAANVHSSVVHGSITDPDVFERIVQISLDAKAKYHNLPIWVIGGPPCQGFSTAGKRRSMDDDRNHLFHDYVRFLEKVQPDGFVFENVSGLLNMDKGRVFEMVKSAFGSVMKNIQGWILSADDFAIPQRRKRVILIGCQDPKRTLEHPLPITTTKSTTSDLFSDMQPAISVREALDDLPSIKPSQDGSVLEYNNAPGNCYQLYLRGEIDAGEYLKRVRKGRYKQPSKTQECVKAVGLS